MKGFVYEPLCKACTAKEPDGTSLRDWLDFRKNHGAATTTIVGEASLRGVELTQPNLDRHFRNHSPWILQKKMEIIAAKTQNSLERSRQENREVDTELQNLVNIGGDRVDTGDIIVDKDLYMFAIDRKLKSTEPVSIKNLVMNFGEALTRRKKKRILDGEVLSNESS